VKRQNVLDLLNGVSESDLKHLISNKARIKPLEKKKKALEKALSSVSEQIARLHGGVARPQGKPAVGKGKRKELVRRSTRKRIAQPSLSSLVVDILREKKKALKVNDICDALLMEKKYKTQAKNFKANVRIVLYKNDKKLFKKVGPGKFGLSVVKKTG
jgi:hypothetical protein